MKKTTTSVLDSDYQKIAAAIHHDPFAVLGRHQKDQQLTIKVYLPYAEAVKFAHNGGEFHRIEGTDFFEYVVGKQALPEHYQLEWVDKDGNSHLDYDPYDFPPQLPEFDMHLFGEGKHWHVYQKLGGHPHTVDGIDGVLFGLWAPNAGRVSVVGDFNRWDGRSHPMRSLGGGGIWELFIPGLAAGCLYKFEILNRATQEVLVKTRSLRAAVRIPAQDGGHRGRTGRLPVGRPSMARRPAQAQLDAYAHVHLRSASGLVAAGQSRQFSQLPGHGGEAA